MTIEWFRNKSYLSEMNRYFFEFMGFMKLPFHEVNSELLDEGVSKLRCKMHRSSEAFRGIFIFMQLSINTASLAP